ncbi:hypothetical protein Pmani_035020 [Petrolisthes manimaculis]|uniref:SH3 domain-containing protein n=1 Tax=Petrolisthes manimaculis TaxID=1843537 RepID=A0AAE1NLC4_9EUCA|nr:hypothetical protein Pmani_035020 [Petrolisthes manimaculis]
MVCIYRDAAAAPGGAGAAAQVPQAARITRRSRGGRAERLRRLRERVEAQEAKLRRLRALRGQVEATRLNTASLTTDLDAMRHLFSEKEKELVVAVSKVEELTRQLEELRHGRSPLLSSNNNNNNQHHHNELDKLRRELLYRNSVNREASARVAQQRETLQARRDEITRIDKRVSELQQRLHRKRLLNNQLASQITAATQAKQAQLKAVQQKALREGVHTSSSVDDAHTTDHLKIPHGEELGEFGPNKSDPKYQTLPYNTKFYVSAKAKPGESDSAPPTPTSAAPSTTTSPLGEPSSSLPATTTVASELTVTSDGGQPTSVPPLTTTANNNSTNGNSSVVTRTVHSIPTHPPSRGHAHAPNPTLTHTQQQQQQPLPQPQQQAGTGPLKPTPNPAMTPRVYGPGALQFNQRSQPLGGAALPLNQKLSPGVTAHSQSRSLLLSHHTQDMEAVSSSGGSENMEEGVVGGEGGRHKPALPPKPAVPTKPQPPPRQKGDPLAGSNESLTSPQQGRGSQARAQQGYRYASQNVIVSTYTQQAAGLDTQTNESTEDNARLKAPPTLNNNNSNNNNINNNNNNSLEGGGGEKVHVSINRRIEMPPDFMFPEDETPPSDLLGRHISEIENGEAGKENGVDETDRSAAPSLPLNELEKLRIEKDERTGDDMSTPSEDARQPDGADTTVMLREEGHTCDNERSGNTTTVTTGGARRLKKGNLKSKNSSRVPRRVSFDPLALLLDASLEGELELVRRTATEVPNPSAANDEGITALHNAICAGHLDIVTFLVTFGCDVNAQDSDGWTPLHCAASCNNVAMVRFLVEHGACILATTLSDHETPAEKCEQDEEGYDGCSQYLYSVQEKLGIMNGGLVYAVYDYESEAGDELSFQCGDGLTILRRGDEYEREWWWGQLNDAQGYIPRNLLGLYRRVKNPMRDS